MKREMARARAGFHFRKAGKHRREDSSAGIEAVDDDLIKPQIGDEGEAVVRRCANPVGMRAFLALLVRAGAGMLDETAGCAEAAVVVNRKRGDAAAIVVRDQNEIAGFVERDVARSGAARGYLIQKLERAGFRVDGESAYRAADTSIEIADFIHGVEILAVGVHSQKGRIRRFRRNTDGGELALLRIEAVRVNPFAGGFCGVRADVGDVLAFGGGLFRRLRLRDEKQRGGE